MFTLETMLAWHLQWNHYPPVSIRWVEPAQAAIEALKAGDPERQIETPFTWTLSAEDIVESLHLWDFIDSPEDDVVE